MVDNRTISSIEKIINNSFFKIEIPNTFPLFSIDMCEKITKEGSDIKKNEYSNK